MVERHEGLTGMHREEGDNFIEQSGYFVLALNTSQAPKDDKENQSSKSLMNTWLARDGVRTPTKAV